VHATSATDAFVPFESFRVLNVRVDAVQISDAIERIDLWIRGRRCCHYVAVTGMQGVAEAQRDPHLRKILNSADLVLPDGLPLLWIARLRGFPLRRRAYGPELITTICEAAASKPYRHFLYGDSPDLCEQLAQTLRRGFPKISIVGAYSPPFRPLAEHETIEMIESINRAVPDIVWVCLSTPIQERWMDKHRERLNAPVLVGVGAAFDVDSSSKKRAPEWMCDNGLEWLFRLLQEPPRLWQRYLVCGSHFAFLVGMEFLGIHPPDVG
jgi:N-acetylglucosaminyldiphosphoundecaprenol N-acetyl-beta-D-mannosaminyltransferase